MNFAKINYEQNITQRYNYITKLTQKCLYKRRKWINKTEILDKIFLSKIFAIPIFIIIMFGIYFLSVGVVGKYTIDIVNRITNSISNFILYILQFFYAKDWLQSLIIDGIFAEFIFELFVLCEWAMRFLTPALRAPAKDREDIKSIWLCTISYLPSLTTFATSAINLCGRLKRLSGMLISSTPSFLSSSAHRADDGFGFFHE